MKFLFTAIFFIFFLQVPAEQNQVNPRSLDSLQKAMDSTRRGSQIWQDSFYRVQDSLYRAAIGRSDSVASSQAMNRLQEESSAHEGKKELQTWIWFAILIMAGILAVVMLRRKGRS